jgi:hypothetical protein
LFDQFCGFLCFHGVSFDDLPIVHSTSKKNGAPLGLFCLI